MKLYDKASLDAFLDSHKISTNGAINQHKIKRREFDDGDTGEIVTIPYWWQNESVARGVLTAALDALKEGAHVYLDHDYVELMFYYSVCDPD